MSNFNEDENRIIVDECNDLQSGIKMDESLLKTAVFHQDDGDYLFMGAHHLVVDGVSWRIIASDLEQVYNQLLKGEKPELPLKTHTYNDYAEALERFRNSYRLELERPYWEKVQTKLMQLPTSDETDHNRIMDKIVVTLEEQATKRFTTSRFGMINADINDGLLTAVSRSYHNIFGENSVSVQFEGHGREDIGEDLIIDRTVGWFTSIYPIVIENLSGDLHEDLINVKETMHRVPNKGVGYNVLRFIEGKEDLHFATGKIAKIGFNYLGEMGAEQINESIFQSAGNIDKGQSVSEKNIFGADISINCIISDGCFRLILDYNTEIMNKDTAESFAEEILAQMKEITAHLDECRDQEVTATDLGEYEWSISEFHAAVEDFAARGETISRIYPLTPMQEGMLLKHVAEPEAWAYRLVHIFEIDALPTHDQLTRALERLARKHEVLRTAIIHEGVTQPRQAIIDRKLTLHMLDYSEKENPEEAVKAYREEVLTYDFDLQKKPLVQLSCIKKDAHSSYLVIASHHMILDGWCNGLFLGDLFLYIDEELNGKLSVDSYENMDGNYEAAVREILQKDKGAGLAYWRELLSGYDTRAAITSYGDIPEKEQSEADELSVIIDPEITSRFIQICKEEQATVNNGAELAWGLVLQTYSRTNDAVFAKVVSGRDNTKTDVSNQVGLFINSVPVRVKVEQGASTRRMLQILQKQTADSNMYDFCPLSEIQHESELGSQLFQSVIAFENFSSGSENTSSGKENGISFKIKNIVAKEENFDDINPTMYIAANGGLLLKIAFNKEHYRKEEIQRVLELFRVFVTEMAENPDAEIDSLARMSRENEQDVLALSEGEKLEYNKEETWLDLFGRQVEKDPEKVAVVDKNGNYTYGELDAISNKLAAYLCGQGIGEGECIAVKMGRAKEFLAAVIALHKIGAAYVPIDEDYPKDRIQYIVENSEAKLILDETLVAEAVSGDLISSGDYAPATPDSLAYMIYTSGSTGKPKGVMIPHRAMMNFVNFIRVRWNLTKESRIACHSNFAFDASVEDLYPVLTAGGTLYIVPEEERKDIVLMREYIKKNGITGGCYTTQLGQLLGADEVLDVDYICLGGEKMTTVPQVTGHVYNTYGPTEFTVDATYFEIKEGMEYNNIPIGRPLYNCTALILDEKDHLLPLGVVGELCLAGPQLAQGYWKLPDKTAEVFKKVRIAGKEIDIYRTGDLARYNEKGNLEYMGRIDFQVKLRGFRIEMGEIESRAASYEGIELLTAQVRTLGEAQHLCLYYTADKKIDKAGLRAYMAEALPEYMVPTAYMQLSEMPMTPNGKVDRKALPEPQLETAQFVALSSDTEIIVAESMKKILGVSVDLGAMDNFFSLGGDSIKAIRLISLLRQHNLTVKTSDIMNGKTVKAIAEAADHSAAQMISQEAFGGPIRNTAIVQYFVDIHLPVPNHYNQANLFKCRERAELDKLQRALNALTVQHDILRAVFKDNQLFVHTEDKLIYVEEKQASSTEEITSICAYVQAGISMEEALLRVLLIHGPKEDYVFMAAHHLIVDGVSWRVIVSDLESAYTQLLQGKQQISLPEKTHNYNDYAEAMYAYRDSYLLSLEIPYWQKVQKKLLSMETSDNKDYTRNFGYLRVTMPAEATKAFLQADGSSFNANVNDLLLTALGRSYRSIFKKDEVSVQFEGHGREDIGGNLVTDRTVGWFTSIYPVILENITGEMAKDLANIKETLHRVPNKGVGYNILCYVPGEEILNFRTDKIAKLSFNYMGDMSAGEEGETFFSGAAIKSGAAAAKENTAGTDFDINCLVANGEFSLSISYNNAVCSEEKAKLFADTILTEIQAISRFLAVNTEKVFTASDLGEEEWSNEEFDEVMAEFAARGESIQRIYPLTAMQEGMLLRHVSDVTDWAYRIVNVLEFDVLLTEAQLSRALERLAEKYEVLRTAIIHNNVAVSRQAIIADRKLSLTMLDYSEEKDPEKSVLALREEILTNGFDLENKSLLHFTCVKKTENSCYLLIGSHHAIDDGWSISLYQKDLFRYIYEEITGTIMPDDYVSTDGRYEQAVREILRKDKHAALEYWHNLLDGYETRTEIPYYGEVPAKEQCSEDVIIDYLDKSSTDLLSDLCRNEQATLSNGIELIWGLILQTYSRTRDSVFAKVVSGRDNLSVDVNEVVGILINSVPVRVTVKEDTTARQMLKILQHQSAESNKYDFCPLSEIQQQSVLGNQLFQSVLAFENYNSGNQSGKTAEKSENNQSAFHVKPLLMKEESFDDITPIIELASDGRLKFHISFNKRHYRKTEIDRIIDLFKTIAIAIIEAPDVPLASLPLVGEKEAQELIVLGAGKVQERDPAETIVSIFRDRVAKTPDKEAVVYENRSYTYAELDRISDNLAVHLKKKYNVQPEENVGVMINRSELMVIYPLAIMKNGAAYMPLDPHFPTDRLNFMCEDASVRLILSEDTLPTEKLPLFTGNIFYSSDLNRLPETTEEEISDLMSPRADNRMVVLFTSGSTGVPKAVELEHHSIANFCHWYAEEFELTAEDKVSAYANFGFDAHMMDLYPAIFAGAAVYILSDEIRKELQQVSDYMEKVGITVAFFTTQVGCLVKDMNHSLRLMSVGGEKLPLIDAPEYRFVNGYGPTECSIYTSTCDITGSADGTYIGRPLANYQMYVIDQNCQLVPRGVAGELLIAGEGVGRGYMNRPELTAEKFILFKPTPESEPVRAYRSGDLVRWAENDQIQYIGRIDKQVKLRGLRIELGEIENRASAYEGIKQVTVDVKNDQLCCYYVAENEIDEKELKAYLAETLTEFMVPEVYMQLEKMPLNANGKVDRKALPEPEVKLDEIILPATELEEKIFQIAAELIRKDHFGVTNNLVSLGMSSLAAMRFSAALNTKLDLNIKVTDIMKNPTIRGIAGLFDDTISEEEKDVFEDINQAVGLIRKYKSGNAKAEDVLEQLYQLFSSYATEKEESIQGILHYPAQEYYPITENQRGIYIDWEMNRETTQYNIPAAYKFADMDAEKLAEAIKKAVDAHSSLKTRFALVNGDVMQQSHAGEAAEVLVAELEDEPSMEFFQSRVRPFDLFHDKLYRAEIYTCKESVYLFLDIHHNLYDGMSTPVLMRDIFKAYSGEAITAEEITSYDFAIYESELVNSEAYAKAEEFYNSLVADCNVVSYADSADPDGGNSAEVSIQIPVQEIDAACAKYGVTVSSYLNAAFAETLFRISREENPMYLTISNGREADMRLSDCVGMFVKTLPVVLNTEKYKNHVKTADFVKDFHEQMQETIENDFYPYTSIVEKYGLHGEIMFIYQGGLLENAESASGAEAIPLSLDTAKLPISINVFPNGKQQYVVNIEYNGNRYSREDMLALGNTFANVAVNMSKAESIGEISLVSEAETKKLIRLSTGEHLAYDKSETWVSQFAAHAASHGDTTAVVDSVSSITYKELDQQSDAVAAYLTEHGVEPNDFVAVKMGRVKEFIVAVLGINKAGAAYVPVDPSYPEDRIAYMIQDSAAKLVLTEEIIQEAVLRKEVEFRSLAAPENYAYMIYTSGSTGKPKGVVIAHKGIMACAAWLIPTFELKKGKKNLHHPSFSFDASTFDLFYPLAAGATVHILGEEVRKDTAAIAEYIETNQITGMTTSTAMGMELLNQYDLSMEYIMLGGEKFMPVKRTSTKLFNGYGPTEFTVCSSYHLIDQEVDQDIPIGRPVPNTWSFICDTAGNLLPQGMAGELCIAGPQMSEGYWNLPKKTADVFVESRFIKGLKMYRTGDLARYNKNGELEYLGRIDFQVKLRGFRIELGEIENCAAQYPSIIQTIAQVKKNTLVLYFSAASEVETEKLRAFMAETLTEYMVPSIFMQLEKMPMTPGGKIDRRALPEPVITSSAEYVAPATEAEKVIAEVMQKVLGMEEPIGALDNFLELGGDSIKAIRIVSLLRQNGINLKVADIMKEKIVRNIAGAVDASMVTISQEPWSGDLDNSAIIEFFRKLDLKTPQHFNQSQILKCRERVDMARLQKAWDAIVYQHDMLRMVYRDGNCYINPSDTIVTVEEVTVTDQKSIEAFCNEAQRSLELNKALVRPIVIHAPEYDYLLLIVHHLIVDGVSWRILIPDLEMGYSQLLNQSSEVTLPEKTHTYHDYVEALKVYRDSYKLSLEIPYWKSTQERMLALPVSDGKDYSRTFGEIGASMNPEETRGFITANVSNFNVDVNDMLLTAVTRSFAKVTGQDSVAIMFEGHGREDIGSSLVIDRTVGWFTSVYPVVFDRISGEMQDTLISVKEEMHRIPNKGVGYSILGNIPGKEEIEIGGYERIGQIGFNYLGEFSNEASESDTFFDMNAGVGSGESVAPENKFGPDMSINCAVSDGRFTLSLDYNADRYTREQAQAFADGILREMRELTVFLAQVKEPVLTASDLGENEWSHEEFTSVMKEFSERDEKISRIYPLIPMQEGMLLTHVTDPKSWSYRLISIYELNQLPNEEQLEKALKRLGAKHEVFRTAIIHEGVTQPRQAIVERKLGLTMLDFTDREDPEEAVLAYRKELLTNGYDLQRKPLFQLTCVKKSENSCYIVVATHHALVDGWCIGMYTGDLFRYIYEEMTGNYTTEEVTVSGTYEAAVREILQKDKMAGLAYWRELLAGYDTKAAIPSKGNVPESEQSETDEILGFVDADVVERFTALCKQEQATISNGIELAWGLVLQTYSRTEDAVFAKVVSGRDNTETEVNNIVGLFINSVPVRVKTEKDMTVRQLLQSLQKQAGESNVYDFCPLAEIQQQSELGSQLFQTVMAFENYDSGMEKNESANDSENYKGFKIRSVLMKEENFAEITPSMFMEEDGRLCIRIAFNKSLYRASEIEGIIRLFNVLVTGIANQPDQKISALPRVSEAERKEILALSKGVDLAYDKTETWVDLFRNQVELYGDTVAVVDQTSSLTYNELDQKSNTVAAYLTEQGIQANDFVAIKMGRVKEFVVAVLGINKAGAAYIPVDPEYPEDRIQYMVEDSEAKVVMTEELIAGILQKGNTSFTSRTTPDHLAYMIYTSGSTGKPKGAMIYQKGFRNFVAWNNQNFGHGHGTNHLVHASFSFDASVFDMLCPLAAGATVHIASDEMRHDLTIMADYINEKQITGMLVTTQIGMALLNGYDTNLKYIALGGEKMLPVRKTGVQVYNAYGPTEFTAASSFYAVSGEETEIPIGRPVPNTYSFVCDKAGNLLPQGIPGELCLAGSQLGAGYWKQPEKTEEVFVDCPFLPGEKMYRTGDLVRYNAEGNLEYMGRIDFQVKLRGFRIELGEIESRAAQYEAIDHVIALVKKNTLVLYFSAASAVDTDKLRNFMAEALTEYMVPSIFMQLDEMPMTPGGKIDRRALPEPVITSSADYVAPATEIEKAVAESMQKILGMSDAVGALDNFFELGGDSIKAIRMVSMLRQKEINIQVSDIMKNKTVRAIAAAADEKAVMISQEPVEGVIKDSAIFRFFKYLKMPAAHHFNLSGKYKLKERGDLELMQKAVNALTYQHDMLRAVIREEEIFIRPADTEILVEEYGVNAAEEINVLADQIQSGIQMDDNLMRIALFHAPDADYLLIALHHTIVDGVSLRIIGSDLELAYTQLLKGEEVTLPLKTHTYKDYVETLHQYRDSYKLGLEIPYWEQVQAKLLKTETSFETNYQRKIQRYVGYLEQQDTENFIKCGFDSAHMTINDALLTAVCRSYSKVADESSVSIQFEGHGREDIGEGLVTDRTIGWFTSIYPIVVEGINGDMKHDLIRVKETMHRLPNHGVGYNILRFIEGQDQKQFLSDRIAKIGFNYLGEMDGEQHADSFFTGADIAMGDEASELNTFGPDLAVNCLVMNGRFVLMIGYDTDKMSEQETESFASGILNEMKSITEFMTSGQEIETTATDLGEVVWNENEFEAVAADFASRGEKICRIYPLIPMQEDMLLKHVSEPRAWSYRIVNVFEMNLLPTKEQLERVLARIGRKHEVLRTAIIYEGVSEPRQAIIDRRLGLQMYDFSDKEDPKAAVLKLREKILTNGYDLQKKPLFQVICVKKAENSCYIMIATHHAIVDGWCSEMYLSDLFGFILEEIYDKRSVDRIPEPGIYEAAVREILQKDKTAALSYWKELLKGYDTLAEIPSYGAVPLEEQSIVDRLSLEVDEVTTNRFTEICKQEHATINNGVELAWGLVLQTYSRTKDAVFAKVVSGRDNTAVDVNDVLGLFINSVPVRVTTEEGETARDMLRKLQKQTSESNTYDFCPLAEIQQQSELESRLFQSVLAFENFNSGLEQMGASKDNASGQNTISIQGVMLREESFEDISPTVMIEDGKLKIILQFNPGLYREEEVQRILNLFETLVVGMTLNPDKAISELPLLSKSDELEMLKISKGEELSYDSSETWLHMFERQVVSHPDGIAVVDKKGSYTYSQLNLEASKLAGYLLAKGIREGQSVAIKMGRQKEFLAAVIAVHRIGALYVPIDEDYPEERIRFIVENSEAKMILTGTVVNEALASDFEAVDDSIRALPESLAYMIYTSGSTGRPKGVMISHRALMNFANFIGVRWNLNEQSRIACHANFAFDASVEDLYPVLTVGGTLFVVPDEERKDIVLMREYIKKNHITGGCYTTQFGQLLGAEEVINVDYICLGGEKMTAIPKATGRVFNTYGPTEFTVDATYYELEKGAEYSEIPIGRPVYNCSAFVLDEQNRFVPQGVVGELCLAGPQIAAGYWKMPEKTEEVFKDLTLADGRTIKVYHSGDLVRYNDKKEIEYVGRSDFQVKLRGFRIELGEIDSRAMQYAPIRQAVAQVKQDNIILYFTAVKEIDTKELEAFMAENLAEYMVPTVFMQLEEMPTTANGKIDLKALPEVDLFGGLENVAPANMQEKNVLKIAKELLPGIEFGVTDDLKSLGLSSIKAIKFAARIYSDLYFKVRVSDIMRYRTIRGFLMGKRRISWLYEKYDASKPTLVLTHGIIPISHISHLYPIMNKYFNLFIIEPIDAHYKSIFEGEHMDEVADFYQVQMEIGLPEDADIFALMGFSIGGELSFMMADRWAASTGKAPLVIMGDTFLSDTKDLPPEKIEQITVEYYEKYFAERGVTLTADMREKTREEAMKNNMASILESKMHMNSYAGHVIFLNAMADCSEEEMERKLSALDRYVVDYEMIEFQEINHGGLFLLESLETFYDELFVRLLKNRNKLL